jgi:acyl dehydratase
VTQRVFFEDIEVGAEGPTFSRKTDFMNWNRYAAVNDEFIYIRMDDDAGRAAGQAGAFGMGNLRWSYVFNALRGWFGDEAEIREVGLQFRAINNKNDVLSTHLRVIEKVRESGGNLLRLEVNVVNQDGERTAPGHAVVALPSRGDGAAE